MFTEAARRRIAHNSQDAEESSVAPSLTTSTRGRGGVEPDIRALLDRVEQSYGTAASAAVVAAARAAGGAANAAAAAPNTDILYIGLNPQSATAEINALGKTGAVHAVGVGSSVGGVHYDFASASDVYRFVDSLALDPRTTANLADALLRTPAHRRPMLAQLAASLADGERGGPTPSRLVISAHSGGVDFYGFGTNFNAEDLQRLAKAMPRAAGQIQDIHFSSCSTSGQAGLEDSRKAWLEAFPHLKTIWAYAGHADLAPTRELEAWGRATNHPHDTLDLPRGSVSTRVATWSVKDGYHDSLSLPTLQAARALADTRFRSFVSGAADSRVYAEEAMADYEAYRVLSQRSDVPANERAALAKRADQLLRVRYYSEGVRSAFAARYGQAIDAAFGALGLNRVDFGRLDRAHALAEIAAFEKRVADAKPVPTEAAAVIPVLRGLRDLEPSVILESDCHHVEQR